MPFLNKNARFFENFHILLWLIKDSFWLLEWRIVGTIMIIPTILVALIIAIKTFKESDFYLNIAVCCWISSNAFWMLCEFYNWLDYKIFAIYPFLIGLLFTGYYFYISRTPKSGN